MQRRPSRDSAGCSASYAEVEGRGKGRSAQRPEGPGIYVHVPFCRRRCGYCDFYSVTGDAAVRREYVKDLLAEIDLAAERRLLGGSVVRTVFLGGGTPSLLTGSEVSRIIGRIRERYPLHPEAEITAEANPESMTPARMDSFLRAGINRVSLGVQSLHARELKLLDRPHTPQLAKARMLELKKAGFNSVGMDLIYGIPRSVPGLWEETLEQALECDPDHLSAYLLALDLNAQLSRRQILGQVPPLPLDEETEAEYRLLRRQARNAGLRQYEISNFSRPGHESLHNLNYWIRGEYLGLGPSAHSHANSRRWSNPPSLREWSDAIRAGGIAWTGIDAIDEVSAAEEWIFLGLRLKEGIEWNRLGELLDAGRLAALSAAVDRMAESGYLERTALRLRLRPRGYFISDAVFRILIEAIR